MPEPLAYFITFSVYGARLHGCADGSVDREHNRPGTPPLPTQPSLEAARRAVMKQAAYHLDEPRRAIVLRTVVEVARHRGWKLWAVHVRTTHVHTVVTAAPPPEKVMSDLKAWASRRLRETFNEAADRDRWAQHGSTRRLDSEESLAAAIGYVLDEQGERMACFDGRAVLDEPEA